VSSLVISCIVFRDIVRKNRQTDKHTDKQRSLERTTEC